MEKVRQGEETLKRTHDLVDVTQVTCSAHLEAVGGSHAYLTHCACEEDAARDAFAALAANLKDMGYIWDDVDPTHHRDLVKEAYAQVEALNRLGKADRKVRAGTGTLQFRPLYVVAWPKGQEKNVIAVEKSA